MKHLLDVNVLLASLIKTHVHHSRAHAWLPGKQIVLCPVCELGFLRIGCHKKAYGLPLVELRHSLQRFIEERDAGWIPADLRALNSGEAKKGDQITDFYLANLAAKHGLKLATFDGQIQHSSVELIH